MDQPVLSREDVSHEPEAFITLTEEDLALARSCGRVEQHPKGKMLFEAGDRPMDFFVIVKGKVAIVETSTDEPRLLIVHGSGNIIGDLSVFTGRPAVAAGRVEEDAELIRLSVADVRRLLVRSSELSEKWIVALLRRRVLLEASGFEGLRVFGDHDDPATLQLREFMHRNGIPHHWHDVALPETAPLLEKLEPPSPKYPAVAWGHDVRFQDPTLRELACRLGVYNEIPDTVFDTVIIGSGPAGLGAAVYAASEGLKTLVLDRVGPGGQAGSSSRIENFAGFPAGISGRDLALRTYLQALKFGAFFSAPVNVTSLRRGDDELIALTTEDKTQICTRTVIIAAGVTYRALKVKGLSSLHGAGVYYSATQVEALLCEHSPVHVIGAGNSAGQAAMYLSRFADSVQLIVRGDDLNKSMSTYLAERVESNPHIRIRLNSELREIEGDAHLERVHIEDTATGEMHVEDSRGVFIFIGATPCTDFLEGFCKDDKGFLMTGADAAACGAWGLPNRHPCTLETSMPGVFTAGDCRSRTTKRVAFAVGDGALAVTCVHDFLGTYK